MTMSDIFGGLKLAMLVFSIIKDPENALVKIIDDFRSADSDDISNIKSGICKKVKCEDILLEPTDTGVDVKFINIQEPIDVFAVSITSFIFNIATKIEPFAVIIMPDVDIKEMLKRISVVRNDVLNTTSIEIPRGEDIVRLDVNYDPEEKTASIFIPIKSEKVLAKLKEMGENYEVIKHG